ncbi:ABC transporter ATP-binding protein [Streptomyces longisporoflavus]|uniref:ABC transporter ATP-binding protein n=1 Tax=Streptomyces longisporoflavus TaxID=28044 RepID=A0ABW7R317_9ACTN
MTTHDGTTTDTAGLAVDVRGLRKRYGEVTALDGIDLATRHGEVFGILGPNGAGKSTTVEILRGNRARDGGEVAVLGADPASAGRAWRSRVGIVWQDQSAPAELTVRETVRQFARYYPKPRDPEDVIALVGLEEKAASRIKSLSGGQRRRLDVALGVIGDPGLLLLDEPTTGFDPAARPAAHCSASRSAASRSQDAAPPPWSYCPSWCCSSSRASADLPVEEPARRLTEPVGPRDSNIWQRSFRLWDSYFAVVWAATPVFVLGTGEPGWPVRLAAAGFLLLLVPWYVGFGRCVLMTEGVDERRTLVYIRGRSCCSSRRACSSARPV